MYNVYILCGKGICETYSRETINFQESIDNGKLKSQDGYFYLSQT